MVKSEYKTEEYKATQGFIYLWTIMMLFVVLSIFIGRLLHVPAFIGIIWIICPFILLFYFEKKIKKKIFTKTVYLEFDDLHFSIKTSNLWNKEIYLKIKWSEIKAYSVSFSPANNTILTIYVRDGFPKTWGFMDNRTFDEAIVEESIFSIFRTYVKLYNCCKDNKDRIALSKGFLNSESGTIILYSQVIIIIAGFIFHIIMHPQSSFLTFFLGGGMVAQLFIKRKQDMDLYNKIKKLDVSC